MIENGRDPEDYEGGIAEAVRDFDTESYEDLPPLGQRRSSEIKFRPPQAESEAELAAKFGFSQPIMRLFSRTDSIYGYIRDGSVTDELHLSALNAINTLNDLVMSAECLNRQGRYEEEERNAERFQNAMKASAPDKDDDAPDYTELLKSWSEAAAFMLQARIVEERDGIEAAVHLYPQFRKMRAQRDDVEMQASRLPPAEYQFFWSRVRQYKIMNERAYDLALGLPTMDLTELKRKLVAGGKVHDLLPEMPWTFKVGYQLIVRSTADGESFRELLTSMYAQQLPNKTPAPWGYPPPGYYPPQSGGPDGDDDEQPDKRRALYIFGGPKRSKEPERKPGRRRSRGRGKR